MTHPAGTVAFDPGARFCFNRGYIFWFEWFTNADNAAIDFDGTTFTLHSIALPGFRGYCELFPAWWNWSSNSYTLDYLVVAWYYVLTPGGPEFPNSDLVLRFKFDPDRGWGLQFESALADTITPFDLEQMPATYWLYPLR